MPIDVYRDITIEEKVEFIFFDYVLYNSIYYKKVEEEDLTTFVKNKASYITASTANQLCGLYLAFLSSVLNINYNKNENSAIYLMSEEGFITEHVLKLILFSYIDNQIAKVKNREVILCKLRERFEFSQQLASHYDRFYKQSSKNFGNLLNYALLGVIAAFAFNKEGDLVYLNLLLKINDLLSGITHNMLNPIVALLSLASLRKEIDIIEMLVKQYADPC
jgi:hypothetical protein